MARRQGRLRLQVRGALLPVDQGPRPGRRAGASSCRRAATWPASGRAATTTRGVHKAPANEVDPRRARPRAPDHQGRAGPAQPGRASTASARSPAAASACGARARSRAIRRGATSTCAGCSTMSRSRSSRAPSGSSSSRTTWTSGQRVKRDDQRLPACARGATARCSAPRPSEAFYVKCDAETNPPEVVDAGQLVVEIGIAPVKPAEFVDLPHRPVLGRRGADE